MFDYKALELKPSLILKKVSGVIFESLSKTQIKGLKHKLVAQDIFSKHEAEECEESGKLIEILNKRSEEQVGKAINIICEDPVNEQISEAVKKEISLLTKNKKVSQQVTDSSMANLLVTDNLDRIVNVLYSDAIMVERWPDLAGALKLEANEIKKLKTGYRDDSITYKELLANIIKIWAGRIGPEATVDRLGAIFRKEGFGLCAHNLA